MQISDEIYRSEITGTNLFRRVTRPDSSSPNGVVLMLHGLGDHQICHEIAAAIFSSRNLATVGIDWPGNGASDGKRGDLPGAGVACDLIDETLAFLSKEFPEFSGRKPGLYAHSTGGFLSLCHANQRAKLGADPLAFDWIWLSSPLIHPARNQNWLKRKLARLLVNVAPRFTVPNGVTRRKCVHLHTGTPVPVIPGRHKRVSLRFGVDLLKHAAEIDASAELFTDPFPILISQGDEDVICPPEISRAFFENLPSSRKEYILGKNLRHETLREPNNGEFIQGVKDWLDQVVPQTSLTV
ncbi:MAG: alpha/beta fold hydrolase [Verrucomicrobiales bacterium]|nr:alpha/beta fold hydrolase [Verrucomicrobiales bacterium]